MLNLRNWRYKLLGLCS